MRDTTGWALLETGGDLVPWSFSRRDLRDDDVALRVTFCGVCHTDLHALQGAVDGPLVPGHEFVGEVVAVGPAVTRFAVGDAVAVGNMVDSCGTCANCLDEEQPYCEAGATLTYGGTDRVDGTRTHGGFSREHVVREAFAHRLPEGLDPAGAAPLLCAGVTVWQPLRRYGVGPGSRVAVVGLGGLGHLGVKLAKALGAHVAVVTRSAHRRDEALALGADEVVLSGDPADMAAHARAFDLVLDTAPAEHDLTPYAHLLDMDGTLCVLGIPETYRVGAMALLAGRRRLTSSGSAGTRDTRDLLAFAAEHGVVAEVEVLPAADVMVAMERLERGDVRGRFVLDLRE